MPFLIMLLCYSIRGLEYSVIYEGPKHYLVGFDYFMTLSRKIFNEVVYYVKKVERVRKLVRQKC